MVDYIGKSISPIQNINRAIKLGACIQMDITLLNLIIKDKLDTIPNNSVNFKVYEYTKEQKVENDDNIKEQKVYSKSHFTTRKSG